MSKKETVKSFLKNHKKELLIAGVSAIGGGILAGLSIKKMVGNELKLYETFEKHGWDKITVDDIFKTMENSNHCATFSGKTGATIRHIGEDIIEHYEKIGVDLDTPVTGMVIFQKLNNEDYMKFQ